MSGVSFGVRDAVMPDYTDDELEALLDKLLADLAGVTQNQFEPHITYCLGVVLAGIAGGHDEKELNRVLLCVAGAARLQLKTNLDEARKATKQ